MMCSVAQNGEDVRQDQLAVHMVALMDRQLKEAGLDLKLKVRASPFPRCTSGPFS